MQIMIDFLIEKKSEYILGKQDNRMAYRHNFGNTKTGIRMVKFPGKHSMVLKVMHYLSLVHQI